MNNELFIIDLTTCNNTGEIITSVSSAFELPSARDRKIGLKLSNIALNQAQMLSIQSLIASYASELSFIETANESTKNICENMGIEVQAPSYNEQIPASVSSDEIAFEIPKKEENEKTEDKSEEAEKEEPKVEDKDTEEDEEDNKEEPKEE